MKKYFFFLCLCVVGISMQAASLPLSAEGKKEADFYFEFLRASLATPTDTAALCNSYGALLEQAPDNQFLRRHLMICALEQDKIEEAEHYADFFDPETNDAEDLAIYGFYKWRKGELAEAQKYYEKSLALQPDDTRVLYQYILLLSMVDIDRAAAILQERKTQHPEQVAVLDYEIGNLYRRHRQFQTALTYYQSATKADPDYADPYLARAELYENTKQYFLMQHELEELEKIGYQSAEMFSRMGAFYVMVQDEAQAKTYFAKAKQLNKGDIAANYFLALYAEQNQDLLQAAQYLSESADYEKNAAKQLQVSFYQQQSGDNAAALHTLEKAYQKFDQNVEIGYFYGLLLTDLKQYRKAAQVLKKVINISPNYESARLAYAYVLESLGRYTEMEKQVRFILAQNAQNAGAYNLLGFSLAERKVRLPEAEKLITQAVTLQPKDHSFLDSLGWVYYRLGKYEQARQVLEGLGETFIRNNAEVAYHLGAVYAALNEKEKAISYLTQAAPEYKAAAKLLKKITR